MTCPAWHRTKIVCTLGPSTEKPGIPEAMIRAGMRVARVNTAHGTLAGHIRRIRQVREAARRADRTVGILVDLPGPKFRLGGLPTGSLELRRGARVLLGPAGDARPDAIPVSHPRLAREVRPGEELFLADGTVRLAVRRVQGPHIFCQVTVGGTVRSGSGLNFPQSKIDVRLPTAEDARWIRFARAQKAEWIGVSFVRSAADLVRVRRLLRGAGENAPLVMAKIEKREALDRLEEIVEEADGVMVARGDLGVETPLEEVPVVQKRIIALAESRGKPVVTATQMLESMVENPSPTRAEVTDVANAILDGTDAVMLSAETAIGKHPVEAVRVLCAVGGATERSYPFGMPLKTFSLGRETSVEDAMSAVACRLSFDVKAKAILVPGGSCRTAFRVARFRPQAPVVVASRSLFHARQLSVAWNVHPVLTPVGAGAWLEPARRWLRERGLAQRGDPAVVISPPSAGGRDAGESVQVVRL